MVWLVKNLRGCIAKKKKVNLIYKGSGFILVDGNISENDLIITTRMPDKAS